MAYKKICVLLSMVHGEEFDCEQEKCQFWEEELEDCLFKGISEKLGIITGFLMKQTKIMETSQMMMMKKHQSKARIIKTPGDN